MNNDRASRIEMHAAREKRDGKLLRHSRRSGQARQVSKLATSRDALAAVLVPSLPDMIISDASRYKLHTCFRLSICHLQEFDLVFISTIIIGLGIAPLNQFEVLAIVPLNVSIRTSRVNLEYFQCCVMYY